MKTRRFSRQSGVPSGALSVAVVLSVFALVPTLSAQAQKKNPVSKIYISDVSGEAFIDTGDAIEDIGKRSVYIAQGAVIETKRPDQDAETGKYFSTAVYSNGTGAFFDADTRVEMRRFSQEPFTPNRSDNDVEPSISQTQAFVARGTVGLCNSKLVAGSSMNYQTPLGSANIRGRKVVIESKANVTKISMLEGESTVRGGPQDLGGMNVKAGEQAIITAGNPGEPNRVQIVRIPPAEMTQLDDKVAMACMAKKTVYFEVRERPTNESGPGEVNAPTEGGAPAPGEGSVTAFDGNSQGSNSSAGTGGGLVREIVPIQVVPDNLPVQFTVSPATIITPGTTVTPGG